MRKMTIREKVRVVDQEEDSTRVLVIRSENQGMEEGGIHWYVPTKSIPDPLRNAGQEFVLVQVTMVPEGPDEMGEVGKHPPRYSFE